MSIRAVPSFTHVRTNTSQVVNRNVTVSSVTAQEKSPVRQFNFVPTNSHILRSTEITFNFPVLWTMFTTHLAVPRAFTIDCKPRLSQWTRSRGEKKDLGGDLRPGLHE